MTHLTCQLPAPLNGSIEILIDASKPTENQQRIHNAGECGTKNNANELKIAPIKK